MRQHLDDLLLAVGAVVFGAGLWMAWPPLGVMFAGLVFGGAGALVAGVQVVRRQPKPEED